MNKAQFKSARSEYRNMQRQAYFHSHSPDEYVEASRMVDAQHKASCGLWMSWFSKPNTRHQVVSHKIFAHLGFPFEKLQEPKWN